MKIRRRWRRWLRLKEGEFLFLWPGGIRVVKDPMFLLHAFSRLRARQPGARLLFVGPILERGYGRRFRVALRRIQGAAYRPAVAPRAMPGLYAAADAVVNSSISEGMSNSLLEAMADGVPVLARANAGNRAVVAHERTGLLFATEGDVLRAAERLLRDASVGRRLARAARRQVHQRHSAAAETAAHLRLYRSVMKARRDARA
ncbi:MAG: glycosyltransferase [Candidatus Acidiferrales bacterium]